MRPVKNTSSRTEGKTDSKAVISHRSDFRLHSHFEYPVPCDPAHRRQVYTYWATLSAKQRTELLTLTKESIRSRVQQLRDAASAEGKKSDRARFSSISHHACKLCYQRGTSVVGDDSCFGPCRADFFAASRGI